MDKTVAGFPNLDSRGGDIAQDGVQVVQGQGDQVSGVVAHQHLQQVLLIPLLILILIIL